MAILITPLYSGTAEALVVREYICKIEKKKAEVLVYICMSSLC